MSYILQALTRSEQERRLGKSRNPTASLDEFAPSQRRFWPWIGIIGLLLINGIVVAVVLWPKLPFQAIATTTPSQALTAAANGTDLPDRHQDPAQPLPRKPTTTKASDAIDAPGRVSPRRPSPEPVRRLTEEAAPASHTVARTPRPAALNGDESPSDKIGRGTRLTPAPAAGRTPLAIEPVEVVDSLPGIKITVHGYSKNPAQSFVFINSSKYKEGQRIGGNGPLLQAIVPDGVVIDYGDRLVHLRIAL
jgi:general secretion pathway protein B